MTYFLDGDDPTDPFGYNRYVPRYDPADYDNGAGPTRPMIAGFLPRPGVTLLAAPPKSGKSTLATALAWSVATGTPFAGVPVEKGIAVYVDYEASAAERRIELARLPVHDHPDHDLRCAVHFPNLDSPHFAGAYEWLVETLRPALVVFDSLRGGVSKAALDRTAPARAILGALHNRAGHSSSPDHPGTAVLVLHHTDAHARRPAESPQLQAACGASALLRNDPHPNGDPDERILTLVVSGRAAGANASGSRPLRLATRSPLDYRPADSGPRSDAPIDATTLDLLAALAPVADREPPSSLDLALLTGRNLGTIRNALTRLLRSGEVVAVRDRNTFRYRARLHKEDESSPLDTNLCDPA